ncbi:MAG: hypothetical protein IKP99_04220 [Bacteroidales bacterium]|nr:hypothetical protein [Bacteroidales bacterium]
MIFADYKKKRNKMDNNFYSLYIAYKAEEAPAKKENLIKDMRDSIKIANENNGIYVLGHKQISIDKADADTLNEIDKAIKISKTNGTMSSEDAKIEQTSRNLYTSNNQYPNN